MDQLADLAMEIGVKMLVAQGAGRHGSAQCEALLWVDCAQELPDDDRTVLMFRPSADSEPVWPGYRSGEEWIAIGGSVMDSMFWPTHWADMPEGPGLHSTES
jgi:hypothetical protein